MRKSIKLREGERFNKPVNSPAVFITGKGANTYLWIGNDAPDDKMCYATLSGPKTLERLACGILTALGHNASSIKKSILKKTADKRTNKTTEHRKKS
jgi:hypothetical protein